MDVGNRDKITGKSSSKKKEGGKERALYSGIQTELFTDFQSSYSLAQQLDSTFQLVHLIDSALLT